MVTFVPGYSGGTALAFTSFPFILRAGPAYIVMIKIKNPISLIEIGLNNLNHEDYSQHLYPRRPSHSDL
jgi:hypothetical protein